MTAMNSLSKLLLLCLALCLTACGGPGQGNNTETNGEQTVHSLPDTWTNRETGDTISLGMTREAVEAQLTPHPNDPVPESDAAEVLYGSTPEEMIAIRYEAQTVVGLEVNDGSTAAESVWVLPGDITRGSSQKDVQAVYGTTQNPEDSVLLTYFYDENGQLLSDGIESGATYQVAFVFDETGLTEYSVQLYIEPSFTLTLPDGFTLAYQEDGSGILSYQGQVVGGLQVLSMPDAESTNRAEMLTQEDLAELWAQLYPDIALGDFTVSDGLYDSFVLTAVTEQGSEVHNGFPVDNQVYDIWYRDGTLPAESADALVRSVANATCNL